MDFLDPAKKRKHGIKLIIGYILVGIAIGLAALILIFLAYGYSLDRKTGTVIQNGIVFLASKPGDAEIYFSGERHKDNTDTRAVLPSGDYTVELKKSGYRPWQRSFFLAGGSIERMVYPLLFPEQIKTTDVVTYRTQPVLASQSPNRRWLLVRPEADKQTFELYDLNVAAPIADTLTLPRNLLSDNSRSFKVVEWSNDNRHVLLEHTYQKGREFVLIDREAPAESLNITRLTKGTFDTMSLRDKKFDQWYLHNTKDQRLFTASEAAPTPKLLIQNVAAYKSHGTNIVLYATADKAPKGKARIMIWDNNRTDELRQVALSKRYLLDVARFDNQWYFAVAGTADGKIYVYRNPFEAIRAVPAQVLAPATIMRLPDAEFMSFSQNTRFIAVQAGSKFALYDAEMKRTHVYDTKLTFKPSQQATWMDGHRMSAVINGQIVVFDYDGINQQTLLPSLPNTTPFFSDDYEQLFTLAPKGQSKEANLVRGELIVSQ